MIHSNSQIPLFVVSAKNTILWILKSTKEKQLQKQMSEMVLVVITYKLCHIKNLCMIS